MLKQEIRRERFKNAVLIMFILIFAAVVTYIIYDNFKDKREVDYNTTALDVTFHNADGDKVSLTRIIPVTDSVGLSSKAYSFTIENNLSTPVNYSVKLLEDHEMIMLDECGEYQMPHDIIKLSIHKNKGSNEIYLLSDIEAENLVDATIQGGEKIQYTLRFWNTSNNLTRGSVLHYHAIIKVTEEN